MDSLPIPEEQRPKKPSTKQQRQQQKQQRKRAEDSTDNEDDDEGIENEGGSRSLNDEKFQDLSISDSAAAVAAVAKKGN